MYRSGGLIFSHYVPIYDLISPGITSYRQFSFIWANWMKCEKSPIIAIILNLEYVSCLVLGVWSIGAISEAVGLGLEGRDETRS